MDWRDEGALLSVRPHGESSAVVEVFTRDHGRHAGVVRGGTSRRMAPVLQPGAQLQVAWRARLGEHLGHFAVEPLRARTGLMADGGRLAALSAVCALLRLALPEREAHGALWADTVALLDGLEEGWGGAARGTRPLVPARGIGGAARPDPGAAGPVPGQGGVQGGAAGQRALPGPGPAAAGAAHPGSPGLGFVAGGRPEGRGSRGTVGGDAGAGDADGKDTDGRGGDTGDACGGEADGGDAWGGDAHGGWPLAYLRWELRLLGDLGFGLDLSSCAVTGAVEGLAFVSPRSGRAVSRAGAGDWADRLLPLPACLTSAAPPGAGDIAAGLALTGHFLHRGLAPVLAGRTLPEARARLLARLT